VELQLLVKLANQTHVVSFFIAVQHSLLLRAVCSREVSDPCNLLMTLLVDALPTEWEVACALSRKTGIPAAFLIVHRLPVSDMCASLQEAIVMSSASNKVQEMKHVCINFFVNATLKSFIRGGKGGFGSLLKGQSKKAAAKTTLDFGACRDLSGRRLRHINDEIKLRKWHQALSMKKQGIDINEDEHYKTKSGIENWFLDIPNWALDAFSDKSRRMNERRIQRNIQRQQWEQQQSQHREWEKQVARERNILEYANVALEAIDENRMSDAIAQGMKRRQQQKVQSKQHPENLEPVEQIDSQEKDEDQVRNTDDEEVLAKRRKMENPEILLSESDVVENDWFCSISGDIITHDKDNTPISSYNQKQRFQMEILIQATSEFSTGCVLLPDSFQDYILNGGLIKGKWYYEVILQTAQVAQIGWASNEFIADSTSGNGVGDDSCSYGYDGSRGLKFHEELPQKVSGKSDGETGLQYASNKRWRKDDVIGCLLDVDDGIISYSINGEILGQAYTFSKDNFNGLFPAVSLNCNEILRVRLSNFDFLPKVCFVTLLCINYSLYISNLVVTVPSFSDTHVRQGYKGVGDIIGDKGPSGTDKASTANANSSCSVNPSESQRGDRGIDSCPDILNNSSPLKSSETETETLDLDSFDSVEDIMGLGLDKLKNHLVSLGVKCGGTLQERAARLFSLKGVDRSNIPKKLLAKHAMP